MLKLFTEHPASVGETYLQHMAFACRFGGRMLLGGGACLLHGLLPFVFTSTGSRTVRTLSDRMTGNRAPPRPAHLPEPEYLI